MSVRDALLRRSRAEGNKPTRLLNLGRLDLIVLSRELHWTRGAEIGVWKGAFSEALLAGNPDLHMLCVDPWHASEDWVDTKNKIASGDGQRVMDKAYQKACQRLAGLNATIVRKRSAEAATDLPDQSLDFVYIDGDHSYDAVTEDLRVWAPKVKPGGVLAGHDYRRFAHKPFIHVVDAVNDFTTARGVDPWFLLAGDRTPSFLWEAA